MYVVKDGKKVNKENFEDTETTQVQEGFTIFGKEIPLWVLIVMIIVLILILVVIFILVSGYFSKKDDVAKESTIQVVSEAPVTSPKSTVAEAPAIATEAPAIATEAPAQKLDEVVPKAKVSRKPKKKKSSQKAKKGKRK